AKASAVAQIPAAAERGRVGLMEFTPPLRAHERGDPASECGTQLRQERRPNCLRMSARPGARFALDQGTACPIGPLMIILGFRAAVEEIGHATSCETRARRSAGGFLRRAGRL